MPTQLAIFCVDWCFFDLFPSPLLNLLMGCREGSVPVLGLLEILISGEGFFFPLVDSEFWNSFPSIGFSDELSGELNPLAEPNRNPYIRGGIRLQIDKVEILPLDPKYINPTPPEEGFEMA